MGFGLKGDIQPFKKPPFGQKGRRYERMRGKKYIYISEADRKGQSSGEWVQGVMSHGKRTEGRQRAREGEVSETGRGGRREVFYKKKLKRSDC